MHQNFLNRLLALKTLKYVKVHCIVCQNVMNKYRSIMSCLHLAGRADAFNNLLMFFL